MASSKAVPLVFFLGFLFCLFSPAAEAAADFNVYSLLWPGSHCNHQGFMCCMPTTGKPAQDFLIEGMYPSNHTTVKPVTNCGSPCMFSVNAIQMFIGAMNLHWSDISCPSNNGVMNWHRSWCTHGTCSGLAETDYFNATLFLHEHLDLLYVLQDNGITPSWQNTYSLATIQQVLAANYGFSTVVLCNQDRPMRVTQLHKIIFCIASDGKTTIGCPTSLKTNCDANIKFPPFPKQLSVEPMVNPIEMIINRNATI